MRCLVFRLSQGLGQASARFQGLENDLGVFLPDSVSQLGGPILNRGAVRKAFQDEVCPIQALELQRFVPQGAPLVSARVVALRGHLQRALK